MLKRISAALMGLYVSSLVVPVCSFATNVEDTVEAKIWVLLLIEKAMEFKAIKSIIALIGAIVFFMGMTMAFSSWRDRQWSRIVGGVAICVTGLSIVNLISGFTDLLSQ
ncbi:MAG: hypothetical protein ACE5FU_04235 [Nitrospinota bacterium]